MKVYPKYNIEFFLHGEDAKLPVLSYDTDAGLDFFSPVSLNVEPHKSVVIDLMVSWIVKDGRTGKEITDGRKIYLQLKSRSSLAIKHGIECSNAGVIDQNYRGHIVAKLYNNSDSSYHIEKGDRIVQGIVITLDDIIVSESNMTTEEYDKMLEEQKKMQLRGKNGFGSTGK